MFVLKSANHPLILLKFYFASQRLVKSMGVSIDPDQWDAKRHRPKRTYKYYPEIKSLLDKWDEAVWAAYYHLISTCNPTKEQILAEAERRMNKVLPLTIVGYADRFIKKRTGSNYKAASVKIYRRTRDVLAEYDKAATFDQIDIDWLDGFKKFLLKTKGFGSNTAAKHLSTFRTFMNDATEQGINKNLRYKTKKVSIPRKQTTKVFLDEKEIMAIYYAPMPNIEKEQARDLFVLQCFTGVRVSDLDQIIPTSYRTDHGIGYFTFTDQKEEGSPEIPAHPLALKILDKYDWKMPVRSDQKYNDHLKDICRIAKIDRETIVTSFPGGVRTDKPFPKWRLVSSHTARRSLICNLYLAGVPVETIKKISGHKSHEAFMAYLRLTPKDHLQIAYKSEFYREKVKGV